MTPPWCGDWAKWRASGATDSWRRARSRSRERCARNGVGPATRSPSSYPRGADQVLAALGVLAAGATYVPIGFDQPDARRAKILQTADVVAALTVGRRPRWPPASPAFPIDAARDHPEPLQAPVFPDTSAIAYVIFTSGSTGLPKGVDVPHSAAMNTIDAVNECFDVGSTDRALALSALEFDAVGLRHLRHVLGGRRAGRGRCTSRGPQPTAWVESDSPAPGFDPQLCAEHAGHDPGVRRRSARRFVAGGRSSAATGSGPTWLAGWPS